MASVRTLNNKISSLQNMKKVMSAMNMIASTKFGRLLSKQASLISFEEALLATRGVVYAGLSGQPDCFATYSGTDHTKSHAILFTADRGLCGAHNNSVLRAATQLVNDFVADGRTFDITAIGAKGANFCQKKEFTLYYSIEISEKTLNDNDILGIARTSVRRFNEGDIDELYIVYNRFVSALVQKTVVEKILPIDIKKKDAKISGVSSDLSGKDLVHAALPLLVFYELKAALANSYLSEHGARMTAMENASNNSEDLIEQYASIKNRIRQTAITNEITEIVSGKEAMKS